MQIDGDITYQNPTFLPLYCPLLSRYAAEGSCSCQIIDSARISSSWLKIFEGSTLLALECIRIVESTFHCMSQPLSRATQVVLAPPEVCFYRFSPERPPSF